MKRSNGVRDTFDHNGPPFCGLFVGEFDQRTIGPLWATGGQRRLDGEHQVRKSASRDFLGLPEVVSAQLAIAQPRRIKATHRRRRKVTAGHFVQRYYDPGIGRFLSVDPMASDMNNGWNFNRFNYAANNPYKFKDPDGRIIDIVLDVGFIIYDVVQIARTGATATNMAALGADVVGAIIPGATGLGAGVRAAAHADDAYKGSKLARNMAEAGNGVKKGVEEAHHIVAKGDRRAEGSREILKRNGLDVHGADNGAAMSKAEHRGVHTSEMHATVESRLQSAEARGTSPASRANEVKCELACMRNELESSGRLK